MFFAFFCLLLFDGVVGVLAFFVVRRVLRHMAEDQQAAELISRHVIAPILAGQKEPKAERKPEVTKTKGTLV